MKAQAAIDRAGEAIAARAVDGVLAEHAQGGESNHARQLPDGAEPERRQEEAGVDRNQNGNRDQKTD